MKSHSFSLKYRKRMRVISVMEFMAAVESGWGLYWCFCYCTMRTGNVCKHLGNQLYFLALPTACGSSQARNWTHSATVTQAPSSDNCWILPSSHQGTPGTNFKIITSIKKKKKIVVFSWMWKCAWRKKLNSSPWIFRECNNLFLGGRKPLQRNLSVHKPLHAEIFFFGVSIHTLSSYNLHLNSMTVSGKEERI